MIKPLGQDVFFSETPINAFGTAVDFRDVHRRFGVRIGSSYEAEDVRYFATTAEADAYLRRLFHPHTDISVESFIFRVTCVLREDGGWQYCREYLG